MSKSRTTKKTTTASKPKSKTKAKPKSTTKKKPKAKAEPAVLKEGDFVLADFVGFTHEDHKLFDTTKEDVAKAENVFDEEEIYQPRLVILGQGMMVPGVDEALIGMKVGSTKKVVLEPEKAFGVRDASQVRIIPRARIKSDQKIVRGMRVRIGNQSGTVRHVGGGRVTVDFNPPLAGHTVEYEISVTKKLSRAQERLEAFVQRRFSAVDPGSITVTAKGKTVTIAISADPRILLNQSLQIWKLGLTHDIETYLKDKYSKVLFTEEWEVTSKPPAE
ncbi:MAG: peptidylprolyl isomerase [Promethearchaeota archaeon]